MPVEPPIARSSPTARAWFLLVALSLPILVLSVDANGVVVLLPTIAGDLHVSAAASTAVVTVSSVAFAAPLILIGRWASRVGPRLVLLLGVGGFGVASAICAAAGSFPMLMSGRVLQGLASACCFATSLAAVDAVFDADHLPVAIGIWGAIGGVGSAAGPLIASVIGETWSWRVFFGVNLALLGLALVLLMVLTPSLPTDRTGSFPVGRLVLLSAGIWAAFSALQRSGNVGWGSSGVIAGLVIGALLCAVATVQHGSQLVHRVITRDAAFRLGTTEATLSNWGSGVIMVLVPLALQTDRGMDVAATGRLFLVFSVPFALGGALSGPGMRSLGPRVTMGGGSALLAVGLGAFATVGILGSLPGIIAALVVAGFGNGVVYSASTSHALAGVDPVHASEASAVLSMMRVLGLALAVSLSNGLLRAIGPGGTSGNDGLRVALGIAAIVCALGTVAVIRPRRLIVQ